MENADNQLKYKKQLSFNKIQFETLTILRDKYKVHLGNFIRAAIREKIKRDFPMIEKNRTRRESNYPSWVTGLK
jgi:hypothetical protein